MVVGIVDTGTNPVVRRRRLGQLLTGSREDAKITREDAARHIEVSPATLGRVERGQAARVRLKDVDALLTLYGVETASPLRRQCMDLASSLREPGWWQPWNDVLPEDYRRLVGLEAAATAVHLYQGSIIPGILQTADYARAVIRTAIPEVPAEVVDRRVEFRMARQARLFQSDGPTVHVILDESSIFRQVGGTDVWRAQLAHLHGLVVDAPHGLLVQVLPFAAGAPPIVSGSFMLLRLREPDGWVAFTETPTGDHYEEGAEAEIYGHIFNHLSATAISPRGTAELISKQLASWDFQ